MNKNIWYPANDQYEVSFFKMVQRKIDNHHAQRPIMRGEPGVRGNRPNDWRFSNSDFAPKGIFMPVNNAEFSEDKNA